MTSILSQYCTSGFYFAPVTKGLIGYMVLTCTALNVPIFSDFKQYIICKLPDILLNGQFWRIFTSKLSFIDTKDIVFSSLLIYYFRVFERRYGSHKFASCLVACQTISVVLEVVVILILQLLDIDLHGGGYLPPGPYGLVFALFASYYADVPRVAQTSFLGLPITGKTFAYLIGLQICSTSPATFISAFCGVFSGLMYRWNVCRIQHWPFIPQWLRYASSATLGKVLTSTEPPDAPIGATIEIQRQEQMELWEQQMMLNRDDHRPAVNGDIPPFMQNVLAHARGRNQDGAASNAALSPPSEAQIQTLLEMGFERSRVISALRDASNDVNAATNILLQQT